MLRFATALRDNTLVSAATFTELTTPKSTQGYGYGFRRSTDTNQRQFIGHNGGPPGIGFDFRYYPDTDDVVVVLTNYDPSAVTAPRETVMRDLRP